MRVERVIETCLYVADVEAAAAWYEAVLDLTRVSTDAPRHAFLSAGDSMLLLFNASETAAPGQPAPGEEEWVAYNAPHGATGVQHVAFGVDELDPWRARLEEHGVVVTHEMEWPGGGRSLYFEDVDHHVVELVTRGTWPVW